MQHEGFASLLFRQILAGLGYLHSKSIAHRHIKLENILLRPTGRLSLQTLVSNVAGAATEAGSSLDKACQKKMRDTADACRLSPACAAWTLSNGQVVDCLHSNFENFYPGFEVTAAPDELRGTPCRH